MKQSQADRAFAGPGWEYRLWEFDPTWPDSDGDAEVSFWTSRDIAEQFLSDTQGAIASGDLPATRECRLQRRSVTYGEAEFLQPADVARAEPG